MISVKFLKKFGLTKADLTNFVKAPPVSRMDTTLWGVLEKRGFGGYADQASSCCGVCELGDLDNEGREECERQFLAGLKAGYRYFVYYSITKRETDTFKAIGFKVRDSFKNHNTGNTVTVLTLKV